MNRRGNCADICPICCEHGKYIFKGKIMKKHDVDYYQCEKCGMIYTEPPYWLDDAYQDAIVPVDTGIMVRNVTDTIITNALIQLCYEDAHVFLDWGGGYGVFTRMMRDLGYNWLWYDKYSQNLLARGFEYDNINVSGDNKKVDFMSAFELFEHFENPREEMQNMLSVCDTILFSTELYSDKLDYKQIAEWWYYAPQTGQHICFYSRVTLEYLAKENNVNYYKLNNGLHLFTKKKIAAWKIKLLTSQRAAFMNYYLYYKSRKRGLAVEDMQTLLNRNGD